MNAGHAWISAMFADGVAQAAVEQITDGREDGRRPDSGLGSDQYTGKHLRALPADTQAVFPV